MKQFTYPSKSSEAVHTVTLHDDNTLTCTCRGFFTPSKCWHVKDATEKLTQSNCACPTSYVDLVQYAFINPMLGRALKDGESIANYEGRDNWSLEVKYDGHRVIVHIDERRIATLLSRDANIINDRVGRHIINLLSMVPPGTYDGELFIPGKSSTDVTRKDLVHRQQLALFDILRVYAPEDVGRTDEHGYRNAMTLPLSSRRQLLMMALSKLGQMSKCDVFQSPVHPVQSELLGLIWAGGGEGVMLKDNRETYQPGMRRWIKFKQEHLGRMRVTGYKAGKLGPHAVVVGIDKDGVQVQCKTLDTKMRERFDANPDAFIGRTLVYAYQQKTDSGKHRHPRCDHFEEE